jgi:oxalate decarboxylase
VLSHLASDSLDSSWQVVGLGAGPEHISGREPNCRPAVTGLVGLVRRNLGHYVENTGDDVLTYIETFRSDHYEEVSLANWLSHLPPRLMSAHLNIPGDTLAKLPRGTQGIAPLP